MSLLQDALKRREAEEAQSVVSQEPPPLPQGHPPPTEGEQDSESARPGKEWVAMAVVLGGFVLLVVLVGILGWMLWSGREPPMEEISTVPIADSPELPAERMERAVHNEIEVPQELERAESVPPVAAELPDIVEPAETPAPAQMEPLPELESDSLPEEQIVADETGEADEWPDIRITAAFQSGATGGTVLIDGQILHVGDEFEGALIREITRRGVVMQYRGKDRLIPVRR